MTKPLPRPGDLINVSDFYVYSVDEMKRGFTGSRNMHGIKRPACVGMLIQTIAEQNRTYYLVILLGGKITHVGLQGWIPEIINR